MVLQRQRSPIARLQPVLPKVTDRISESSTLDVNHLSPRARQPWLSAGTEAAGRKVCRWAVRKRDPSSAQIRRAFGLGPDRE